MLIPYIWVYDPINYTFILELNPTQIINFADISGVPTSSDLPNFGNVLGDAYFTEDTGDLWVWNGSFWQDLGLGGTTSVGATGPAGATGPQGIGISFKGSVTTYSDLPGSPVIGDAYITTDTGDLWIWNGASWTNAGDITGPSGASGAIGLTGQSGASGAQGDIGPSGASGAQGITGQSGASGAQGIQGISGASGAVGATGNTGASGAQGISGASGAVGATGNTGASGAQGISGASGAVGATGNTGASGAQGVAGPSGASGAIGLTGQSGASGAQGDIGPSGAVGATGYTGPSGAAGSVTGTASDIVLIGPSGSGLQDSGIQISTDGTFSADSDSLVPTQKAVETYIDTTVLEGNQIIIGYGGGNDVNTQLLLPLNNDVVDYSENELTVTNNGVTFANSTPEFTGTYYGVFNGVSSYLSVPSESYWTFALQTDFTIDLWFNFSALPSINTSATIISNLDSVYPNPGWEIYYENDSGTYKFVSLGGNNTFGIGPIVVPYTVSINTWYHLAWVRSNETYNFYINGVLIGTHAPSSDLQPSSLPIIIGAASPLGNDSFFNGNISELRISTVARWTSNFTPPTIPYNINTNIVVISYEGNPVNSNVSISPDGTMTDDSNELIPTQAAVVTYVASQQNAGSTGPSGTQGPQGYTGPSGATGQSGASGAIGLTGQNGASGAQGIAGPSGAVGATGYTGPSGAAGSITGTTNDVVVIGASGAGLADSAILISNVCTLTNTVTLTNKRITRRVNTVTTTSGPSINTDTTDLFTITGLTVGITSFTTNLSGTPVNGDLLEIRILDNGSVQTLAWGASFASTNGATLPTATNGSSTVALRILLEYNSANSGGTWECIGTA